MSKASGRTCGATLSTCAATALRTSTGCLHRSCSGCSVRGAAQDSNHIGKGCGRLRTCWEGMRDSNHIGKGCGTPTISGRSGSASIYIRKERQRRPPCCGYHPPCCERAEGVQVPPAVGYCLSSLFSHLSSVICHLSSLCSLLTSHFSHLSSLISHLSSLISHLSSVISHLSSLISHLSSLCSLLTSHFSLLSSDRPTLATS